MNTFKNWSGSVQCSPTSILYPSTEEECRKIVLDCLTNKKRIRITGSGHSFTPLCATDEILISLDNYKGIIHVDKQKQEITVKAGTKIFEFGRLAHEYGYAQENLGDIDRQSLAGSISTGTHGTGINFGNISTQVVAIKFINGKGEVVFCSEKENIHIFKAAQISIGSLGIIVELTFKVVASYKLSFTSGKDTIEHILENYQQINNTTRNFEFYWFPYTHTVQTKYTQLSEETPRENKLGLWFDNILENYIFGAVSFPTRFTNKLSPAIAKLAASVVGTSKKINWSHKVYALPRSLKFNEMEYNIPYEAFAEAKREVVRIFRQKKFDVHFPTENRFAKSDDIWLSPAYGRNSAYIAFHVYKGKPFQEYFKVMEDICRSYEGRPHWGKMHTLTADTFVKIYPKWEKFLAIRKEQDPHQVFISPYLKLLFGI